MSNVDWNLAYLTYPCINRYWYLGCLYIMANPQNRVIQRKCHQIDHPASFCLFGRNQMVLAGLTHTSTVCWSPAEDTLCLVCLSRGCSFPTHDVCTGSKPGHIVLLCRVPRESSIMQWLIGPDVALPVWLLPYLTSQCKWEGWPPVKSSHGETDLTSW